MDTWLPPPAPRPPPPPPPPPPTSPLLSHTPTWPVPHPGLPLCPYAASAMELSNKENERPTEMMSPVRVGPRPCGQ